MRKKERERKIEKERYRANYTNQKTRLSKQR